MVSSLIQLGLLGILLAGAESATADPVYRLEVRVSGAMPGKGQMALTGQKEENLQ